MNVKRFLSWGACALLAVLLLTFSIASAAESITHKSTATAAPNLPATSLTVSKPAGVVEGDFLLAQITFLKGSDITVTAPAGWTLVRRDNRGSDIGSAIYRKFAGTSEPASYTWGFSESVSANGGILAYLGVDPDNPIIASSGNGGDSGNLTALGVTAEDNSRLVAFLSIKKRTTLSTPGGMTERYFLNPSGDERNSKAADQDVMAGATGNRVSTPGTSDKWVAQLVALRAAAAAEEPETELEVTKDATTSFTRTFNWDIEKSVTPDTWNLFSGDSGTSQYTVTVVKDTGTDSNWAVSGDITIHNPHPTDSATITDVTDSVDGVAATVNCGVTFPHSLAAGGTLICSYSASLPDGANWTNTATITTSGAISGGTATAPVTFGNPTTVVNDEITVSDSDAGNLGSFNQSSFTSYDRAFTCDGDEGEHDNTATINETGQSDDASVMVNCYELTVTKGASTSVTRTWEWTIDKSADQTNLLLADGQLFQVNYEVTVDASATDSNHAISGDIWIANANPSRDATLTAVSDVVSPAIAASVNCPSLTVPAGDSLQCTYSANLPDASQRTNTATATLQNHDYDADGSGQTSGTTAFTGNANVDFSSATINKVDECVDVSDTNVGFLGTVCAGDAPETFNYSLWFGKHPDADVQLACGNNNHTNTASFVTDDTGATGEDDWTVNANVACANGCTLTQGYWKTHSEFGPAPYDNTWALLANGASTPFFPSGKTYYQVLWTAPAGNAYYILAHQYIAAQLNQLNGADFTSVQTAFNSATSLFNTYTPAQVAALKGNSPVRNQFLDLATTLDRYNNGLIGPGHCSE